MSTQIIFNPILTVRVIFEYVHIYFNCSIDANMEDDRTHVNSVLNYNGSVIWVEPVQYSIHCQTDTTLWPHDMHYGVLRLGSWMYKGSLLNLTTDNSEVSDPFL